MVQRLTDIIDVLDRDNRTDVARRSEDSATEAALNPVDPANPHTFS